MTDTSLLTANAVAVLRDKRIDDVAAKICAVSNRSALHFAVEIGRIVIDDFYGSNIERWRVRGPKDTSLRRLAGHPGLPISATTLYRAIAIYELSLRVGDLSRWPSLGPSQLRVIVCLEPEEQMLMLDAAEQNRWSAQQVQESVRAHLGGKQRGGRRAMHKLVAAIRAIRRTVRSSAHLAAKRGFLDSLDNSSRALVNEELRLISEDMSNVQRLLLSAGECSPRETASA